MKRGGKDSSPGLPPVEAVIFSHHRLAWDDKTFSSH